MRREVRSIVGAFAKRRSTLVAAYTLAALAWLGLTSWRLTSVPGMSMDEAWYVLSARGQWAPVNALSGMTSYTGTLPVLLLHLFGTSSGLLVLRGASLVSNGAALAAIAVMLARIEPGHRFLLGGLAVVATFPAWLILMRTGIEVNMFTASFTVLGFYLLYRGNCWSCFGGGVLWGLSIYNHLVGLFGVVAVIAGWFLAYRRRPTVALLPAVGGLLVGVLPRVASVLLYDNDEIQGRITAQDPSLLIANLRWVPQVFWDTLLGRTVYLRYVGRIAVEVWPFWCVTALLVLPWWRSLRELPRHVWFALLVLVFCLVITALGAPYLAPRYLMLPMIAFGVFVALVMESTHQRHSRWAWLARGVAFILVVGNLYYLTRNFYLPWSAQQLGATAYRLGPRSPPIGSWHFLPKDELASYLRNLSPPPQQIVGDHSLQRVLRVLLDDTGMAVAIPANADKRLPSVLVDYARGRQRPRRCVALSNGRKCFQRAVVVDRHFIVYR